MTEPVKVLFDEAVKFGKQEEQKRIIELLQQTLDTDFGSNEIDYQFYRDLCERLVSIIKMSSDV